MPTVILTTRCPNSCEWCFARAKMEAYRAKGVLEMGWEDFVFVVDFHERSGLKNINLLGGDPMLHSRLPDLLDYLRERGFHTQVGTTGAVPARLVDRLAEAKYPRLEFGVNSTSYFDYDPEKRKLMDYFMSNISYPVGISYTFTDRDVYEGSINPLLDRMAMIHKFSLIPHLTLQIAVPYIGTRCFVPFDGYGKVIELLELWIGVLEKNGISHHLDCHCIPRCQLPANSESLQIAKSACTSFVFDIGPDREIWPCFPLSERTCKLDQFTDLNDVQTFFSALLGSEDILYEENCAECPERLNKTCHGGCRGFHVLRRESHASIRGESGRRNPSVTRYERDEIRS
ncbi:MAG: radical SAM protein [Deltaproteobacteria bacterium]|nr:radical SAM protein [Deltaproteobacteria bacterium]